MKYPRFRKSASKPTARAFGLILSCLAGVLLSRPVAAFAQDPPDLEPQISLIQANAQQLIDDLESAMSLTTEEEQKQTEKIRDFLELSFKGMDYEKLLRMDFLVGEGPVRYRPAFPIANRKVFWVENLGPNDIDTRQINSGLYETTGAFDGYMRLRSGYAIFGKKLKDLPLMAPPPDEPAIAKVLNLTDHTALKLENVATPKAVQFRRKSYHDEDTGLRAELLGQIEKTKTESQDAFDLRELTLKHQLDHLERFYVEAANAMLLAHHDPAKKTVGLEFNMLPIKDTPLAKHVQSYNQAPLSFANVPQAAKSNLSLRIRLPLDEMHQKNLTETFDLLRRIARNETDRDEEKSADQKEATLEIIDLTHQLVVSNTKSGIADGFVEAHPNPDGTNTATAAFKAVDGNTPLEILKRLEKTRDDQKVTLNLAQADGVSIHSFLVSDDEHPGFRKFFGSSEMFVGTSDDTIWLGAGPSAVEEIQAAVQEVAKPNTGQASDPFLTMSGRAAPWMEFYATNFPEAGNEQLRKYRRMIVEAGQPGDDQYEMTFIRKGDLVSGRWLAQPGWTRFIGKYLADFARHNMGN